MIFEPPKINSLTVSTVSPSICHGTRCHDLNFLNVGFEANLSPPAPAVPAGNLAWLKDSGREAGVFRLAKQWPRSSAPTEDTPGSGSPARPQGWETTPPPPGLDVAGGAGPRPGLGGRSDPQVPHPSPAEPARVVKAGSEPLRAVTALARVMGARGGADTE